MKPKIIIIIIIQCITLLSCDRLKLGGKEMVGEIDKVTNGTYKIAIKLDSNKPSWNIHIGNPFEHDYGQGIIDKNRNIMNKRLKLNVINDSKFDMWIFTFPGECKISPKSSVTYFKGTLEDLMSNTNPITLSSTEGIVYKFTLEFQFEEKNIKIQHAIPIIASWSDAL